VRSRRLEVGIGLISALLATVACSAPNKHLSDATTSRASSVSAASLGSTSTTWSAPNDPTALASQLTAAELALRNPSMSATQLRVAGQQQQLLYRRLRGHLDDWLPAVLANIPESLRPTVQLIANAGNLPPPAPGSSDSTTAPTTTTAPKLDDTLPAWRIVEPPPASELLRYYKEAQAATGVSWTYLAAIHLIETRMGRIVGLSSAGAQGPMQFLPSTWARCCTGNIDDPHDAILGAARYLVQSGAPADMGRAVFTYNRDRRYESAVDAYARAMQLDERAYYGFYEWRVFYSTSAGDVVLDVGYDQLLPIPATDYLAAHPDARA